MADVKTQRGGDVLGDFVGKGRRAQAAVDYVTPAQVDDAVEAYGIEPGTLGLMADEIKVIAKAAKAMLNGPLSEDLIILMLQSKLPKEKNGRPVAASHLHQVLHALASLDSFTKPVTR